MSAGGSSGSASASAAGVPAAAPSASDDSHHPRYWQQVWDDRYQRYYYFNVKTKESSWLPPVPSANLLSDVLEAVRATERGGGAAGAASASLLATGNGPTSGISASESPQLLGRRMSFSPVPGSPRGMAGSAGSAAVASAAAAAFGAAMRRRSMSRASQFSSAGVTPELAEIAPSTPWVQVYDSERKAPYYFNVLTRKSTWVKPKDFDDQAGSVAGVVPPASSRFRSSSVPSSARQRNTRSASATRELGAPAAGGASAHDTSSASRSASASRRSSSARRAAYTPEAELTFRPRINRASQKIRRDFDDFQSTWSQQREAALERARNERQARDESECTFQPKVNRHKGASSENLLASLTDRMTMFMQRREASQRAAREAEEKKEAAELKFKPEISKYARKLSRSHPAGSAEAIATLLKEREGRMAALRAQAEEAAKAERQPPKLSSRTEQLAAHSRRGSAPADIGERLLALGKVYDQRRESAIHKKLQEIHEAASTPGSPGRPQHRSAVSTPRSSLIIGEQGGDGAPMFSQLFGVPLSARSSSSFGRGGSVLAPGSAAAIAAAASAAGVPVHERLHRTPTHALRHPEDAAPAVHSHSPAISERSQLLAQRVERASHEAAMRALAASGSGGATAASPASPMVMPTVASSDPLRASTPLDDLDSSLRRFRNASQQLGAPGSASMRYASASNLSTASQGTTASAPRTRRQFESLVAEQIASPASSGVGVVPPSVHVAASVDSAASSFAQLGAAPQSAE